MKEEHATMTHQQDCEAVSRSAQWAVFDKVLNWINEQEDREIRKKDLYAAVMEMRPE